MHANLNQTNGWLVWIAPIRVGVDGDEAAAHLSINTDEADEGRWKTTNPGAGTRSSIFPQITATLRRVGGDEQWGMGQGRPVARTSTPFAALLLRLRCGLAVMNGFPGLCGVVLSTQVKEQRIGRMGVGSQVIKRRLHEWPLRRSYQARIVAPALRSV